jgi:hypothetical protein
LTLESQARDDVSSRLLISADRQVNHSYVSQELEVLGRLLQIGGLVIALLAFLYSLAGIAMAYWVAALPNQTPEHVRLNFIVWVPAALLTLSTAAWLAVSLWRERDT